MPPERPLPAPPGRSSAPHLTSVFALLHAVVLRRRIGALARRARVIRDAEQNLAPADCVEHDSKVAHVTDDWPPNVPITLSLLRLLRQRHDAAHRHLEERQGLSLLQLLHLRPGRQVRLQGADGADGEARPSVTHHVAERVLMPERLMALLQSVVDRRVKADAEVQGPIDELSRETTTAEDKLQRLYQLVADGIAEPDDMLKEQIAKLKADRERAHSALERIENKGAAAGRLDPDKLARFGQLMRSNITEGEVPFRKAYLRSLIDAVEVDQHVVPIHGSKTVLERAVPADRATHSGVCGFVRKWRALGEGISGVP